MFVVLLKIFPCDLIDILHFITFCHCDFDLRPPKSNQLNQSKWTFVPRFKICIQDIIEMLCLQGQNCVF